jgi:hypothetical protein
MYAVSDVAEGSDLLEGVYVAQFKLMHDQLVRSSETRSPKMAFKSPHVFFVSFAVEITPTDTSDVMVVETDLHLNSRHLAYNDGAVQRLVAAAQNYLAANAGHVTHIRLVSSRAGEI